MDPQEDSMATRILRQLEVKNLNQAQMARTLKVSRTTVTQWCQGSSKPRPEQLVKIAELLFDGDVHYLVFGPAREPPNGFPSVPPRGTAAVSPGFISPVRRRRRT
jgi:transcriptional regulator with XRE-family HTH domain